MKLTKTVTLSLNVFIIAGMALLLMISMEEKKPAHSPGMKHPLKLEVYEIKNGWAYDIRYNDRVIIKQENIPAIQASVPFGSKEDAFKTGNLVINKLQNRIRPVVSIRELDSLNLKF